MPDVKIYGPYRHGDGYRCYLRAKESGARSGCETCATPQAAIAAAQRAIGSFIATVDLTVGELVERYLEHLRVNDRKPPTLRSARDKLRLILGPLWDLPPTKVAARQAKARYQDLAASGCAVASHHVALERARSAWAFAVDEGLARENPWTPVRPIGRPKRGKPQLTLDEAAKLRATCLPYVMDDDGALAVLMAQEMPLRSSEITMRTVREVDGNGTLLRVGDISDQGKSEKSKRPLRIPAELQPAIRARIAGRQPMDLLLQALNRRQPQSYDKWLRAEVRRYCELAGVPVVVPHALRGQWASIAYEAGVLPDLVAAALGHASPKTTEHSYALPASVESGKQTRQRKWLA